MSITTDNPKPGQHPQMLVPEVSVLEQITRARLDERERIASMVETQGCTGLPKHGGPLCGDEGYTDENCLKHAIAAMIREQEPRSGASQQPTRRKGGAIET